MLTLVSPDIRLMISVSSNRDWKQGFCTSYLALLNRLLTNRLGGRLGGLDLQSAITGGAMLSQIREDSLQLALDGNFTHWLSLDDDMTFPADCAERLFSHGKQVVTANYMRKTPNEVKGVCLDVKGQFLDSRGKTGLEQLWGMGMGMTLIALEPLRKTAAPRFEGKWNAEHRRYWGEDYAFCQLLHRLEIPIWCDHDLSREMGHVGDFVFKFSDYEIVPQLDKAA